MSIADGLRRSVKDADENLHQIAKATGINYATMYEFMQGRSGLRLDTAEKLFRYFGWTVEPPKKKRPKRKR